MELVFVSALGYFHQKAEEEAAKAERSARITEAINHLVHDIYGILALLNSRDFTPELFASGKMDLLSDSIEKQFQVLNTEYKEQPKEFGIVRNSNEAAAKGLAILRGLSKDQSALQDDQKQQDLINDIKQSGRRILSKSFIDLNSRAKEVTRRSPIEQAIIRKNQVLLLWCAVVLNILTFIIAAFWLVRSITSRLQILNENATLFAENKPLRQLMNGSDEIATVDNTFHKMAEQVREAARKERAVIEQALDVICSINANGVFLAVNPAVSRLLGVTQSEFLGTNFEQFVFADDIEYLESHLKRAQGGEDLDSIEVRMVHLDKRNVDTIWSMHWSEVDSLIFCVIHDDTERKHAERMRQDMVAMLTHDLRTPLNFIGNFLELLHSNSFGEIDSTGSKMLTAADDSVKQMALMVDDMLDFEKAKTGLLIAEPAEIHLLELLESICVPLKCIAERSSIQIILNCAAKSVNADRRMLERVISNLIANAIKFSSPGTEILLTATESPDNVEISVKDQGTGIPEKELPFVFEKYIQASSRKQSGSGLGLAICKIFVELNDGKISVNSIESKGTTVSFTLPRS